MADRVVTLGDTIVFNVDVMGKYHHYDVPYQNMIGSILPGIYINGDIYMIWYK